MRSSITFTAIFCLLIGATDPARTDDLEGTLRKVKETGTFTIGHRESSLPLSYLGESLQPAGFSIELCKYVADAVRAKLGMPDLVIKYNAVTSANRIPLVANGRISSMFSAASSGAACSTASGRSSTSERSPGWRRQSAHE